MSRKARKLEIWMFGFVAGLIAAIILGAGASRMQQWQQTPKPILTGPKSKRVRAFPLVTRHTPNYSLTDRTAG
jgi:hypothetical protein